MKFFSGFLSSVLLHSAKGGEDPVDWRLFSFTWWRYALDPHIHPVCLTLLVPLQSLTFSKGSVGFPSQLCRLHYLFYLEDFFTWRLPFHPSVHSDHQLVMLVTAPCLQWLTNFFFSYSAQMSCCPWGRISISKTNSPFVHHQSHWEESARCHQPQLQHFHQCRLPCKILFAAFSSVVPLIS